MANWTRISLCCSAACVSRRLYIDVERRSASCEARVNHIGQLRNGGVHILGGHGVQFDREGDSSDRPPSPGSTLCSRKLPPRIRARFTSERLPQAWHSVPRLLLMASQSRQKTAVPRGTTSGCGSFHVPAETCFLFELISVTSVKGEAQRAVRE